MTQTLLAPAVLLELLESLRFGVEYQPLISACDSLTYGYEALARFHSPTGEGLSPALVFDSLHDSPLSLFQVELAMKKVQLAQAPDKGRLFVNLDPHAASAWGELDERNPLVALFAGQQRIVVELIENTSISDARISQALASIFSRQGTQLALDDLGAPQSLLSLPIMLSVDFIKFDRSWAQRLDETRYRNLMLTLTTYARSEGKRTVLEGIETPKQRDQARTLGVDFLQGFLFRDRFVHYRPT